MIPAPRAILRQACLLALLATAATCGGSAAAGAAADAASPERARGFPGFDTARYPGDSAMRAWRAAASPYRWVGYYLPAPCHRDASWAGTRARLTQMGWGIAVLYVGQQAWEGVPDAVRDSSAGPIICSRALLTSDRGRQDADDAIARATADGFARGTVIYLDLEPMTSIAPAMRAYYQAWFARLIEDGRYRPGVYAHDRNAAAVLADLRSVTGADAGIPVWLARPDPAFDLVRAPAEAGAGAIRIWQGRVNVDETWGGVTLRIDANVADRASPSDP